MSDTDIRRFSTVQTAVRVCAVCNNCGDPLEHAITREPQGPVTLNVVPCPRCIEDELEPLREIISQQKERIEEIPFRRMPYEPK